MKKAKPIIAWAGFVSNQLMTDIVDDGWGGFGSGTVTMLHVFKRRKDARKRFQDVRKVEIREVKSS